MIKLTIFGNTPSKSNCYRIITLPGKRLANGERGKGHSSLTKTDALKNYERNFYRQLTGAHKKALACPLTFRATVFYDSRRPDIDNATKVLLDCLQKGGVIVNDRQFMRIILTRGLDTKNPRVEMELTEYIADDTQTLFPPDAAEVSAWIDANAPDRIREFLLNR